MKEFKVVGYTSSEDEKMGILLSRENKLVTHVTYEDYVKLVSQDRVQLFQSVFGAGHPVPTEEELNSLSTRTSMYISLGSFWQHLPAFCFLSKEGEGIYISVCGYEKIGEDIFIHTIIYISEKLFMGLRDVTGVPSCLLEMKQNFEVVRFDEKELLSFLKAAKVRVSISFDNMRASLEQMLAAKEDSGLIRFYNALRVITQESDYFLVELKYLEVTLKPMTF